MKRIISLDFMRGIAMIGVCFFHAMLHLYPYFNEEGLSLISTDLVAGILIIPILILSQFRSLFLMISITVFAYSNYMSIKKGAKAGQIFKKNLISGVLLLIVAFLCEAIFANWGYLGRLIELSGTNLANPGTIADVSGTATDYLNHILHFETLHSIAFMMIILGSVFAIFAKLGYNSDDKKKQMMKILIILAVLGYLLTPFAQLFADWAYTAMYGFGYNAKIDGVRLSSQYYFTNFGEFIVGLFFASIAGVEQPIFPFLGAACLGAMLGIELASDKVEPKILSKFNKKALFVMIPGTIIAFLTEYLVYGKITFSLAPHSAFIQTLLDGMELLILIAVIKRIDFNPKADMEKIKKNTKFARRFGMVSLSIFVLQIFIEYPIRLLAWLISGQTVNFLARQKIDNLFLVIFVSFICIFAYFLVVKVWEKVKFVGSFEWLMGKIAGLLTGAKGSVTRIDPAEVLDNPEPVIFIEKA